MTSDKYDALIAICRSLYDADEPLSTLIERHGITQRQLQRQFREYLGTTPKQFQLQVRFNRFLKGVQNGQTITDAIYDAGFGATSRMYEQISQRLGMSASSYVAQANQESIFYATMSHQSQTVVIAQTLKGLCFTGFYADVNHGVEALSEEFPKATLVPVQAHQLEPIHTAVEQAINGDYQKLNALPLDIRGTAFQCQVWEAVRHVQPGLRVSYQTLAKQMNKPKHSRAVAQALARNKIALAIPCHRVVPASGGHGGYRWGENIKQTLLDKENAS